MTDDEKPRFLATIAALAVSKPGGKDLTADAMELYWRSMCSAWTLSEFRTAADHLMRTSEFMPNPYHFEQLRKAGQATPGEAFAKARATLRGLNPAERSSHRSDDARLDAAMQACGGYEALAMCTHENIGFFERRFVEHYESIVDAESVREALPRLAGAPRLSGTQPVSALLGRTS